MSRFVWISVLVTSNGSTAWSGSGPRYFDADQEPEHQLEREQEQRDREVPVGDGLRCDTAWFSSPCSAQRHEVGHELVDLLGRQRFVVVVRHHRHAVGRRSSPGLRHDVGARLQDRLPDVLLRRGRRRRRSPGLWITISARPTIPAIDGPARDHARRRGVAREAGRRRCPEHRLALRDRLIRCRASAPARARARLYAPGAPLPDTRIGRGGQSKLSICRDPVERTRSPPAISASSSPGLRHHAPVLLLRVEPARLLQERRQVRVARGACVIRVRSGA
jgi:hypothetical protein